MSKDEAKAAYQIGLLDRSSYPFEAAEAKFVAMAWIWYHISRDREWMLDELESWKSEIVALTGR